MAENKRPTTSEANRLIDEAESMTIAELRRIGAIYGHHWLKNLTKKRLVFLFKRVMQVYIEQNARDGKL
jgi:hypothetical protein